VATVSFDHGGDMCLGFFKEMYEAGRVPIPKGAKILEIGCAEWDFCTPMKQARPDVHITAVDQRGVGPKGRPGADVLHAGDGLGNLLDPDMMPAHTFDVIVAVSVIEHVGIGRYQDDQDPDGDIKAMRHCRRWLKPDGLMYLDVPYRPEGESTPFRQYNEADLQARVIQDWRVVDRQFFPSDHQDGPYIALVLQP
jgi:SAM-dependent methyltransferase